MTYERCQRTRGANEGGREIPWTATATEKEKNAVEMSAWRKGEVRTDLYRPKRSSFAPFSVRCGNVSASVKFRSASEVGEGQLRVIVFIYLTAGGTWEKKQRRTTIKRRRGKVVDMVTLKAEECASHAFA